MDNKPFFVFYVTYTYQRKSLSVTTSVHPLHIIELRRFSCRPGNLNLSTFHSLLNTEKGVLCTSMANFVIILILIIGKNISIINGQIKKGDQQLVIIFTPDPPTNK